jgi:hypothetical protein
MWTQKHSKNHFYFFNYFINLRNKSNTCTFSNTDVYEIIDYYCEYTTWKRSSTKFHGKKNKIKFLFGTNKNQKPYRMNNFFYQHNIGDGNVAVERSFRGYVFACYSDYGESSISASLKQPRFLLTSNVGGLVSENILARVTSPRDGLKYICCT